MCPVRKYFDDCVNSAFLLVHPSGFIRKYAGATCTVTHQVRQLHATVLKIKHCSQYDCIVTVEREKEVMYICAYHNWRRNPDAQQVTTTATSTAAVGNHNSTGGGGGGGSSGSSSSTGGSRNRVTPVVRHAGRVDEVVAEEDASELGGGQGAFKGDLSAEQTRAYQLPLASLPAAADEARGLRGGAGGGGTRWWRRVEYACCRRLSMRGGRPGCD